MPDLRYMSDEGLVMYLADGCARTFLAYYQTELLIADPSISQSPTARLAWHKRCKETWAWHKSALDQFERTFPKLDDWERLADPELMRQIEARP